MHADTDGTVGFAHGEHGRTGVEGDGGDFTDALELARVDLDLLAQQADGLAAGIELQQRVDLLALLAVDLAGAELRELRQELLVVDRLERVLEFELREQDLEKGVLRDGRVLRRGVGAGNDSKCIEGHGYSFASRFMRCAPASSSSMKPLRSSSWVFACEWRSARRSTTDNSSNRCVSTPRAASVSSPCCASAARCCLSTPCSAPRNSAAWRSSSGSSSAPRAR